MENSSQEGLYLIWNSHPGKDSMSHILQWLKLKLIFSHGLSIYQSSTLHLKASAIFEKYFLNITP